MKTISFINLKGGVGKTTISTNLAYLISESWELRVLFIDNDKQGNASRWFGHDELKGTLANLLMDGASVKDVVQTTRYERIDLIAADMGLLEANFSMLENKEVRQDIILCDALQDVQGAYDICIIDNPPDINMSVFNALSVTDDVIIVTLLEADSIEGIHKMAEQVRDVQGFNPHLAIRGVLVNQYNAYLPKYNDLEQRYPVFDTAISYATPLAKYHLTTGSREGKSIFETCPSCRVARDIMRFAEELLS